MSVNNSTLHAIDPSFNGMHEMQTDRDVTFRLKVATDEGIEIFEVQEAPITVGRAKDNSVVLRDWRASRYHFRLEPNGVATWRLVDVGSQNGTSVNGRRVRKAALRPNDVIQVGGTKLTIERAVLPDSRSTAAIATTSIDLESDRSDEASDALPAAALVELQQIARAMNSELVVETLLNQIVDGAIRLTGAERGFLILVGRHELQFRVARNFERRDVGTPEFAVSWSIATQVSSSGQAVLCVNAAEDERFASHDSVLSMGLRSVMCVPFKVRNRILGVIYVDNRLHQGAFTRTEFRVLEMLADQAAIALENARLYSEVLEQKRALEDVNARLHLRVEESDNRLRTLLEESGDSGVDTSLGRFGVRGALIGDSQQMRELATVIKKVATSDLPLLVTGESGTGKEIVARLVHQLSRRAERKLVSENCCAIPESLLESELFGYRKGAFTGANSDREGLFESANGSTILLDEIGDLTVGLQTKLLRVLQESEVRPLGSKSPTKIDIRLITTTNRDLAKLIEDGRFREDLFYRIKVVTIQVPPLRKRKDDIPLLVEHFLALYARESGSPKKTISREALELLKNYYWPGNVRELENEVRTLHALGSDVIEKNSIPVHIQEQVELLVGEESGFHDLNQLIESIESREIMKAMRRSRNNKTKASELLGISRFALQRKLDKYGLDPGEDGQA